MPTATTYLKSHKRADKRTALQSLKDRFDYGLNPEKLGAVSSYLCDPATAHAEFIWSKISIRAKPTAGPDTGRCATRSGRRSLTAR